MAEAPPSKRQRLLSCLHTGGVTASGLRQILQRSASGPPLAGRNALLRANHARFISLAETLHVPRHDGTIFDWKIVNPNLLVCDLVSSSQVLQELYAEGLRNHPVSADNMWNAIVSFDEFTPGNKRSLRNARKTMVFSFTFLELGPAGLCHELAWFTSACIRSTELKNIVGGWSNLLRLCIRQMMIAEQSMFRVGLVLTICGAPVLLHARVKLLLSDLDGLRAGLDWMGAGSHRPCPLQCTNVWKKNMTCCREEITISCSDYTRFKPMSNEELLLSVDTIIEADSRRQDGRMQVGRFRMLEQGLGIHPNPLGLLADKELRPHINFSKAIRTDWIHNELQKGVFAIECDCIVAAAKSHGITFQNWRDLLRSSWKFPGCLETKRSQLGALFDAKSEASGEIRGKASDYLGLYVLMRFVVESKLSECAALRPQVRSFLAACVPIDLYLEAKRMGLGDKRSFAAALRQAKQEHFELHKAAYGESNIVPKFHASMHGGDQVAEDKAVIDMLVVERLNLRLKRLADPVMFTGRYEYSILSSLLTKHYNQLQEANSLCCGLRGKRVIAPFDPAIVLATGCEVDGCKIMVNDVVFDRRCHTPGIVISCASEAHSLYAVVQLMRCVGDRLPHSARYRVTETVRTIAIESVVAANAWFADSDGSIIVCK